MSVKIIYIAAINHH